VSVPLLKRKEGLLKVAAVGGPPSPRALFTLSLAPEAAPVPAVVEIRDVVRSTRRILLPLSSPTYKMPLKSKATPLLPQIAALVARVPSPRLLSAPLPTTVVIKFVDKSTTRMRLLSLSATYSMLKLLLKQIEYAFLKVAEVAYPPSPMVFARESPG
jgi:hypothetical protein